MSLHERLTHLPRETRDTLFLLAVIAWVLLPQFGNIPLWCSVLASTVLVWRGVLAWRSRPLPRRLWIAALLAATLLATWATHRTLIGREAGVTLIVVLLALKTLELRARRDAFVVFFLGFFVLLTHFLQSQSLLVAASMLLGVLGLLTALVNAHMPVGKPPLLQAARTALWMAALGAPVMAALFVLFPRVGPLWGVPGDTGGSRTGLSSTLRMGAVANLALDESIALRVRFDTEPPPANQMYFRGPVLGTFDGTEWRATPPWLASAFNLPVDVEGFGTPVRYTVTQEPSQRPWLLLLETPAQVPQVDGHEVTRTRDLQWLTQRPLTELVRTQVQSYPQFRYGPKTPLPGLAAFVELPPGSNPRTAAWAAQLRADPRHRNADGAHWVDFALSHLAQGGYVYTLDPGLYGPQAVDEFWFDRKEGFCEHMAASFVVLMRALGVPARIVTGYQGGERNPLDGYWVVRQSDAHAWAEVWLAGQGWVRVDPTGAVAPSRVGALQRLATPRGVVASALGTLSPDLALRMRAAWDAVNNRWNQWVLGYGQARQFDLLRQLGFNSPSWTELGYVTASVIALALLGAAAFTRWERRQHDPWLRQLDRARSALAGAGLPTAAHLPPRGLAHAAQARFGPPAQALHNWLLALEQLRYAPKDQAGPSLAELAQRLPACTAALKHHNTA